VLVARRRWHSAQAGKPNCRAGEAADHRDSENDTFHHDALLLKDKPAKLSIVRERRHARELGCALRLASLEARHRHQAAVERNGAQTWPIVARSFGFGRYRTTEAPVVASARCPPWHAG
jgi:hypothetical protein